MCSFRSRFVACAVLLAALVGLIRPAAIAQDKKDEPKLVTGKVEKKTYEFKEAKKDMEYALYLPSKYDKEKKYPLIIALHGLGGALYEELEYDDGGQPLTGTFMDYLVPTASEAPTIEIAHVVSPSPLTTLGSKGLGESSSMTVPAVIANAVSDALAPLGIRINQLPMTPSRLWTLIRQARRRP